MKRSGWMFLLGMMLLVATQWRLLQPGLPTTHDGQNHLARMANYYLALKGGQLPPRWAPNLNNRFGYPVFNFNYPLANMMAVPGIVLNIGIENTFKFLLVLSLVTAYSGMYLLIRQYAENSIAVVASLAYALSPYGLSLIYVRGVIGELLAYALLPVLLWLIDRVVKQPQTISWYSIVFALITGMFLISHNIIVMFSIPLFAGYTIWRAGTNQRHWLKLLIPAGLGLGLSMFFWLPALMEKGLTKLDQVDLTHQYIDHFPTLKQLLISPWDYGLSRAGPVDGMSFSLGLGSIILWLVALTTWIKNKFDPQIIGWCLGISLLLSLIMLDVTARLWEQLPWVQYIQYPWRLSFYWMLAITPLLVWLLRIYTSTLVRLLLVGFISVQAISLSVPQNTFSFDDAYWFSFPQTSSILAENMPRWIVDTTEIYRLGDEVFKGFPVWSQEDSVNIDNLVWDGTGYIYEVETQFDTRLWHRTVYFPGWKVWLDGSEIPIDIESELVGGVVSFLVLPGNHTVESRFTQLTWPRVIGNGVSVLAFMGIIGQALLLVHQQLRRMKK